MYIVIYTDIWSYSSCKKIRWMYIMIYDQDFRYSDILKALLFMKLDLMIDIHHFIAIFVNMPWFKCNWLNCPLFDCYMQYVGISLPMSLIYFENLMKQWLFHSFVNIFERFCTFGLINRWYFCWSWCFLCFLKSQIQYTYLTS